VAQRYTGAVQLQRMAEGKCPECGVLPDEAGAHGGLSCGLTALGAAARIHQYRRDQEAAQMDVNAALAEAREAMYLGDTEEAAEKYAAVDEWVSKGGFLPEAWAQSRS
jgi:hypothetical protein